MSGSNARFVWYELMSKDPDGSKEFYSKLMNWSAAPWEGEMPYTMWMNGESPVGGLMELPEDAAKAGAPTHWMGYVGVDDVDATAKKADEIGGKTLVGPRDIPGAGRFAVLCDPTGATIAIYKSEKDEQPSNDDPKAGEVSWHELMSENFEEAFSFYNQLFGWTKHDDMDMGEAGVYRLYGAGERTLGGMFNKPAEVPMSAWMYYFEVPEIQAAVNTAKTLGGNLLHGPMEVPGGTYIAQMIDPQGGAFALHAKQSAEVA